jgi:CRISPR-associated protein Csm3
MSDKYVKLFGRVILKATILTLTGLHIGGAAAVMEIGGLDKAVVRNTLTGYPYIPGSSLRGKMRSQLEKYLGLRQNNPVGQATIHTCRRAEDYQNCKVCKIFGVPGDSDSSAPTRLVVRDAPLTDESANKLRDAQTDFPYTEIKWEVAIDRVTSAANPRNMERVPAGAEFAPVELVFSLYDKTDIALLNTLLNGMQLVEDDYLGAAGSRGSGKVCFKDIQISARHSGEEYTRVVFFRETAFANLQELTAVSTDLEKWVEKIVLA